MKMLKPIALFLITLLVLSCFSTMVFAESPVTVKVDDKVLKTDTPAQIIDGRTMVPLRAIMEALGLELEWDAETQTITASNKDYTILLPVGSKVAIVNGKPVALDTSAVIIGGRTMVPARFISENVGADVKWDGKTNTVNITSADNSKTTNNSSSISNINNSSVTVTNNNVDNSVNNSNNTVNNIDNSTHITNNITNNITVNVLNEDLLKQLLKKLEGTEFVTNVPDSNSNPDLQKEPVVVRGEKPVIIPFKNQVNNAWQDGILTYEEAMGPLNIAVILPKGVGEGKLTGVNTSEGFVKRIEITDQYGNHVAKTGGWGDKFENDNSIAIVSFESMIFVKLKDGKNYKLRAYIEKDGKQVSEYSEPVSFTYKDNPSQHIQVDEIFITEIRELIPGENLYNWYKDSFESLPSFVFSYSVIGEKDRAMNFAQMKALDVLTRDFVLRANGMPDVKVQRYDRQGWNSFGMKILEPEKIVKGVAYQLVPLNKGSGTKWVVEDGLSFKLN